MKLYGASGHGKVIKDILEANGRIVDGFIDDNQNVNELCGLKVSHEMNDNEVIVSIGVNHVRKMIVDRLKAANSGMQFATAIHPSAVVAPSVKIGEGSVVMAGAVINADAVIGK